MNVRIAWFSRDGHTEKIVTELARVLDAGLVRIEPVKEPGAGIAIEGMKALLSMTTPIKPCRTDCAGIDTLVIATPVWSGKVPPYVSEYLVSITGCQGKPFHVITCMRSQGSDGAVASVRAHLEKKGMKYVSSAPVTEHEIETGAYLATIEQYASGIRRSN
jgi:menaquinone-dependent protoporphyrinogen IX oxidase